MHLLFPLSLQHPLTQLLDLPLSHVALPLCSVEQDAFGWGSVNQRATIAYQDGRPVYEDWRNTTGLWRVDWVWNEAGLPVSRTLWQLERPAVPQLTWAGAYDASGQLIRSTLHGGISDDRELVWVDGVHVETRVLQPAPQRIRHRYSAAGQRTSDAVLGEDGAWHPLTTFHYQGDELVRIEGSAYVLERSWSEGRPVHDVWRAADALSEIAHETWYRYDPDCPTAAPMRPGWLRSNSGVAAGIEDGRLSVPAWGLSMPAPEGSSLDTRLGSFQLKSEGQGLIALHREQDAALGAQGLATIEARLQALPAGCRRVETAWGAALVAHSPTPDHPRSWDVWLQPGEGTLLRVSLRFTEAGWAASGAAVLGALGQLQVEDRPALGLVDLSAP